MQSGHFPAAGADFSPEALSARFTTHNLKADISPPLVDFELSMLKAIESDSAPSVAVAEQHDSPGELWREEFCEVDSGSWF